MQGYASESNININYLPLSGSGAPTSTPSFVGQIYIDTTAKREYKAYGTSSSADWLKVPVYASGIITITGGGGDVTVTLPWDWSGGFLELFGSNNSANWSEAINTYHYRTSYDAITNAGYSSLQNLREYTAAGTDDGRLASTAKTTNAAGTPKSATTTTFVLDDDGNTKYYKYFVWA